jgi:MFS family permease
LSSANLSKRTGFASVLWSSCLAILAVGANGTAIMAALPTIQTELSLSSAGVQWAVNAYLVVSAACIVLGGQAADRFGARLASMVGLALFGVASCIIASAGAQTELLAGRALQGLAAAVAVPGTLAAVDGTVTLLCEERDRSGPHGFSSRRDGLAPRGIAAARSTRCD